MQLMRRNAAAFVGLLLAIPAFSYPNNSTRSPTAQDDSQRGNVVGRIWVNLTNTHWFKATSVSAGAAAWTDNGAINWLPADASVGTTPAFDCGTTPLTTAWANGNLFDVQRASDSTSRTIAAISGVTDIATLNSFCSGTVCQATKCYDQSGNARDATQGTIANAPFIRVVGTQVYFVFSKLTPPPSGSGNYFFNLPSVAWGTTFSFFQMSQLSSVVGGYQPAMFELGTATTDFQAYYVKSTSTNSWSDETAVNLTASGGETGTTAESNPQVFSMISGSTAGSATAFWGERSVTNGNWKTKGSPTGGIIGKCVQCTSGPGFLDGTVQAVIIYTSALSTTNAQLVRLGMYQLFGVVPQLANFTVITDGDSEISNPDHSHFPQSGTTSTTVGGSGYGAMLYAILNGKLNQPVQWINTAITGELLGTIVSNYSTRDAALMSSTAAANVLAFNGGEHEADVSGQSPATVFASLQSFYTTLAAQSAPAWAGIFYIPVASYNQVVASSGVTITSGTYNSGTGAVSLTMSGSVPYTNGYFVHASGLTGTGAFASLDGNFTTTAGTTGTTVNYTAATGLGTTTITGGTVSETMEQWRLGGGGFTGFNTLVAAGPLTGNSGFVDIGSDPNLGCQSCYTSTNYFWTDGIHIGGINAQGSIAFGNLLAAKLNQIIAPNTGGMVQ